MTVLFVLIAVYQVYHGGRRYLMSEFRIMVDPQTYPVAALRFIQENQLEGDLIVPFDWGEHAIWKLYPKCRVSIDGRFRTVYPEAVIRDHFVADGDWSGWESLIEKYPADILLARQLPFFQRLVEKNGPWIYVYSDALAIVFVRQNQKTTEILKRFRAGQFIYPTSPPAITFPG